jgi:protein tyrosine/serine phosphatase
LDILSDPERLPALIHCEQGKDRTGVIIAIILSACGVDRQVIVDDYSKSRQGLVIEYEDVKDEMNDLGLDDEFAKTRPEVSGNGLS